MPLSPLYKRLNNFASTRATPMKSFWTSPRLCLTSEEFASQLLNIQFYPNVSEQQLMEAIEFISMEDLMEGVPYWKEQEASVAQFLTGNMQHRQTAKEATPVVKNSKFHLKEQQQKQVETEMRLNGTLLKVNQQSEYEIAMKVGEMNDICRRLKREVSYVCRKDSQGITVLECEATTETPLTIKKFIKKYEQLKSDNVNSVATIEGTLEDDLRKTLLEVMCLSAELQEQIKVIEEKQIGH